MHAAMHLRMPALRLLLALWRVFLIRWSTATMSDPKAIDPREYVDALVAELNTAVEQKDAASVGTNHQCPTTPETVARTMFLRTSCVQ
mmetsp:Transcript_10959/g.15680  ORF Transcript_10959/g.15680 Transcript_10959/m.15680 type:complete len:88 (+) Transcript_10959:743-1006(+)